MSDEVTSAARAREQAPASLGSLVESALAGGARGALDEGARAMVAWCRVNGDVERAHTAGVFVAPPRRGARDPELVVYVDSGSCVTDFSANREVYLARLETAGLRFSRITFRRSKYPAAAARPSRQGGAERPRELPELPAEQAARVDELCADLQPALRDSVSRAMRASMRRELGEQS